MIRTIHVLALTSIVSLQACGSKHSDKAVDPQEQVDQQKLADDLLKSKRETYKQVRDTAVLGTEGTMAQYRAMDDKLAEWIDGWQKVLDVAHHPQGRTIADCEHELSDAIQPQTLLLTDINQRQFKAGQSAQASEIKLNGIKGAAEVSAQAEQLSKLLVDTNNRVDQTLVKFRNVDPIMRQIMSSAMTISCIGSGPATPTTSPLAVESQQKFRLENPAAGPVVSDLSADEEANNKLPAVHSDLILKEQELMRGAMSDWLNTRQK